MYLKKTPYLVKLFSNKNLIWDFKSVDKSIYLTFDDGPTPGITEKVLTILDEFNAKATFFCLGKNVKDNPDIFQKIITQGHSVGNHTYDHFNGWKTNEDEYLLNIKKAEKYISSNLFRPPYGRIKKSQIQNIKNKYKIILWTVLSGDFDKNISKEKCLSNVINYAQKGSIIVFHDSVKAKEKILFALPEVLKYFSDKGFSFERIQI